MRMETVTKIGFFSPVETYYKDPLGSLTSALKKTQLGEDLSGSLIVLPEAFNIKIPYGTSSTPDTDSSILSSLQDICKTFDIAVVAGLIIDTPDGPRTGSRYASAHLIDARNPTDLLCYKHNQDSRGPYVGCNDGYDRSNPRHYLNVAVVTLICMDSYPEYIRNRLSELAGKLAACVETRILCIPAFIDDCKDKHYVGLLNSYRIIANSANDENAPFSVIEYIDATGQASAFLTLSPTERREDVVKIKPLPSGQI
jgi:hypothetical protein